MFMMKRTMDWRVLYFMCQILLLLALKFNPSRARKQAGTKFWFGYLRSTL
jgi:hypothetical protein